MTCSKDGSPQLDSLSGGSQRREGKDRYYRGLLVSTLEERGLSHPLPSLLVSLRCPLFALLAQRSTASQSSCEAVWGCLALRGCESIWALRQRDRAPGLLNSPPRGEPPRNSVVWRCTAVWLAGQEDQ